MDTKSSGSGGIGLFGVMFIVFLILKLCGIITWSWWWVTCPLWGPLAIVLLVLLVIGLGVLIFSK